MTENPRKKTTAFEVVTIAGLTICAALTIASITISTMTLISVESLNRSHDQWQVATMVRWCKDNRQPVPPAIERRARDLGVWID